MEGRTFRWDDFILQCLRRYDATTHEYGCGDDACFYFLCSCHFKLTCLILTNAIRAHLTNFSLEQNVTKETKKSPEQKPSPTVNTVNISSLPQSESKR